MFFFNNQVRIEPVADLHYLEYFSNSKYCYYLKHYYYFKYYYYFLFFETFFMF